MLKRKIFNEVSFKEIKAMIHTHNCFTCKKTYHCNEEFQKNWENEGDSFPCEAIEELECLDCLILSTENASSQVQ